MLLHVDVHCLLVSSKLVITYRSTGFKLLSPLKCSHRAEIGTIPVIATGIKNNIC